MATAAVAVITVLFLVLLVVGFMLWSISQAIQAGKYRKLIRMYHALPKQESVQDRWKVVYKEGKVIHTVMAIGKTEKDAMGDALKRGIPYNRIVSLTKE